MGSRDLVTRVARAAGLCALAALALGAAGCTNSGANEQSADVVRGKQLFVEKCGACHTLQRAGTKGTTGPNLDDAFHIARVERWGDASIRGVVYAQILYPGAGLVMPAKLVEGRDAEDVAAYVGAVAGKPGKDGGLLATAVKQAGGGTPAVEKSGRLSIAVDPGGQLKYVTDTATAAPGRVEIAMPNTTSVGHDLVIEGNGVKFQTPIVANGVAKGSGVLQAGDYVFYCSVPGHRQAGMEGKLTVK